MTAASARRPYHVAHGGCLAKTTRTPKATRNEWSERSGCPLACHLPVRSAYPFAALPHHGCPGCLGCPDCPPSNEIPCGRPVYWKAAIPVTDSLMFVKNAKIRLSALTVVQKGGTMSANFESMPVCRQRRTSFRFTDAKASWPDSPISGRGRTPRLSPVVAADESERARSYPVSRSWAKRGSCPSRDCLRIAR